MRRRLAVIAVFAVLMVVGLGQFGSGCGMVPFKPLPPLGCQDVVPQCVCYQDQYGQLHCEYQWQCVPY